MKYFMELYYRKGSRKLGSDCTLFLDGRLSLWNMKLVASQHCKEHRLEGFTLHRGNFRNSTIICEYTEVKL